MLCPLQRYMLGGAAAGANEGSHAGHKNDGKHVPPKPVPRGRESRGGGRGGATVASDSQSLFHQRGGGNAQGSGKSSVGGGAGRGGGGRRRHGDESGGAGRGGGRGRGGESSGLNDSSTCTLNIKVAGDERVLVVKVAKTHSIDALKHELLQHWQQQAPASPGAAPSSASFPHTLVRLIFAGRQLEADKNMQDYNFGSSSGGGAATAPAHQTIHMVLPTPETIEQATAAMSLDSGADEAGGGAAPNPIFCSMVSTPDGSEGKGGKDRHAGGRDKGGGGKEAKTQLSIACQAKHYGSGAWCRAERGARASCGEVTIYFHTCDLPSSAPSPSTAPLDASRQQGAAAAASSGGVEGGAGVVKRKGVTMQVTKDEDVRLRAQWWRALKDEDLISLEPLSKLKYAPFELAGMWIHVCVCAWVCAICLHVSRAHQHKYAPFELAGLWINVCMHTCICSPFFRSSQHIQIRCPSSLLVYGMFVRMCVRASSFLSIASQRIQRRRPLPQI